MDIESKKAHGKDKNSTSGRDARGDKSSSHRLGDVRGNGYHYGAEQIGTPATDHQRENLNWEYFDDRASDLKKILERLEALEERHLTYVRAHKSRLQARFDEDVVEETQFMEESNQLRSDIYTLATQGIGTVV